MCSPRNTLRLLQTSREWHDVLSLGHSPNLDVDTSNPDNRTMDDVLGRMRGANRVELQFPCPSLNVRESVLPLVRHWVQGDFDDRCLALGHLGYRTPTWHASFWPVDEDRGGLDELVRALWCEGKPRVTVQVCLSHAILGAVTVTKPACFARKV